jgi:pimeloyl-ACP methyl ester carboxylesterase
MLRVAKKSAATVQALVARAGQAAPAPAAGAAPALAGPPEPWGENAVARHTVVVGAGGRPVRQLVEASDEEDGVQRVVTAAKASGLGHVALYAHGGLNDLETGLARARKMGPWFAANGVHPIFLVWQTGFLESAKNVIESFARQLLGLPPPTRGGLLEIWRERQDRTFETLARNAGVKAIWEDMKGRAESASLKRGAVALVAQEIADELDGIKVHLIGHSAGAILLGHFLTAASKKLNIASCHLWAPACTVELASATYGRAISAGSLPAKEMFIEALSDSNEKGFYTVPALYSKSLLYLVSRALEQQHKTPILGMAMAEPDQAATAKAEDIFGVDAQTILNRWYKLAEDVVYDPPISVPAVPTRIVAGRQETIPADHGSFDNNLDSFNLALARMLGKKPPRPATDLTGF